MRKPVKSERWEKDCQAAENDLSKELPQIHTLRHLIALEHGSCQWRGEYAYKLIELQEWCLKQQPRTILELGSGYTTVVLSRYARDFGARLVTVEEDQNWLSKVQGWIPEWYRQEVYISASVRENGGIRYCSLPDLDGIDLLYVDGPSVVGPPTACLDAVVLAQRTRVANLLYDMRHISVDAFRDVPGYGFEPGGSYEWSCPEYLRARRHHSWFWRKL